MENEALITERLLGTAEYFGKEISKAVIALYLEALQPYSDDEIVGACTTAIRTLKFFPRVSDFVNIIEGDPESRAAVAWATLIKAMEDHGHYHTVAFKDGAIMSAVNAMGGWMRICEYTYDDLNYRQKEFDRLYRQFSRPGQVHPKSLMGWFEADNRSKGYLTGATTPWLIGTLGTVDAKKITSNRARLIESFPDEGDDNVYYDDDYQEEDNEDQADDIDVKQDRDARKRETPEDYLDRGDNFQRPGASFKGILDAIKPSAQDQRGRADGQRG